MPPDITEIGRDWLAEEAENMVDHVDHITPVEFNEQHRYLPESVAPKMPGYIRYDVNPFMREIVNCFDVDSPVREVALKKGVQITYTTVLESGVLYYAAHIGTVPMMYATADKELAEARIENNFIPMFNHSDFGHLIASADIGNKRKTGKTKKHIQFVRGGYLIPAGAKNADKMRAYSMLVMLQDEIDAWPEIVGKDGDPVKLFDDRCAGAWESRKIFRGSTPTVFGVSKIDKAYFKGDQREYLVLCKHCGYPQKLRWETLNKETGVKGGFAWDLDENGTLITDSVRWCCAECGRPHFEHDKTRLFATEHGAHWKPTAHPAEPNVRSYHLPAFYSPVGMAPWSKCVLDNFAGQDPVTRKIIDIGKYQIFYNNILAKSFKVLGDRVRFVQVSGHRRPEYRYGEIPNGYADRHAGSSILLLTCQVDVHKHNLAVAVMGWCVDMKPFLIDYWRFETDGDCAEITDPTWGKLREVIEEKIYTASDGKKYRVALTLIDAGYANDTVTTFCQDYAAGVYPILGRDRPGKNAKIKEFEQFTTQSGTLGYKILVDHYKDRIAPVLRRSWHEAEGHQKPYHFNAPVDATDAQLQELTKEIRREVKNERGETTYVWHRSGNARNELWDLLVYGHAAVEILAWSICIEHFELKTIDWPAFWGYIESEKLYFKG